jgi:hypothetical protein
LVGRDGHEADSGGAWMTGFCRAGAGAAPGSALMLIIVFTAILIPATYGHTNHDRAASE